MPMQVGDDLDIKLAVYMERLDSYIDSQTKLNENICNRVEKVSDELDELKVFIDQISNVKRISYDPYNRVPNKF